MYKRVQDSLMVVLIPSFALLGCKSGNEDAKSKPEQEIIDTNQASSGELDPENLPVAGFLSEADLAEPEKKELIIPEAMPSIMPKLLGFSTPLYVPSAESELDPDIRSQIIISEEICPEKFWQGARIKVMGDNLLIIDQEVQYECKTGPDPADPLYTETVTNVEAKYFLVLYCEGKDMNEYVGKSAAEFVKGVKTQICGDSPVKKEFLEFVLHTSSAITYLRQNGDLVDLSDISKVVGAIQTEDGKPCGTRKEGDKFIRDACTETFVKKTDFYQKKVNGTIAETIRRDDNRSSYLKFSYNNNSYSPDQRWYLDGMINFQKDDWVGSVDFTSEEPSWKAANGDQSSTGVLSESAAPPL